MTIVQRKVVIEFPIQFPTKLPIAFRYILIGSVSINNESRELGYVLLC